MKNFGLVMDWICGIGSTIAAMAWAAWGFGWIAEKPTANSADIMVILFYFQASFFFHQIARRSP